MRHKVIRVVALLFLLVCAYPAICQDLLIKNGIVLPVTSKAIPDCDLLILEGKIKDIGK